MSDATSTPAQDKSSAAKKKTNPKPKKPAEHPPYAQMIVAAIKSLKERNGSSRQAITKYILANYKITGSNVMKAHLKLALKHGVEKGLLKHSKGTGASGSFRLEKTAEPKKSKPKAKKPVKKTSPKKKKSEKVKKPAAKKSPKKDGKKKPAAKKAKKDPKKSPKKVAAKPAPKKASPKKQAKKPAAKKQAKK